MNPRGTLSFGTDIDLAGFQAGLARMKSLANGAAASIGKSLTFGGGIASIAKGSAASAIGNSIAGGIGKALESANVVKTAADMEKRVAGLGKAADLSGAGLAGMKSGIVGLSTSLSGVPINDLVDIATAGAKMGVASGDLLKYSEGVAKVSTAIDDLPAGVVAESIGKLNTVFKLGVGGTMQFGSAIDKVADSGISSAADILNVTQRISGTAVAAKLSAQEAVALSGALLDTGTQAELGASALSRLIQNLNNAKSQAGFADAIGVSAGRFARTVETKPIVAIQRFLGAIKKMDAAGQQSAIKGIGIKSAQGIGEIQKLAQVSDTLGKYIKDANHEFVSLDQITKSYNATAGLTTSRWVNFQNQVQMLKDKIGSALLPGLNAALGGVGRFVSGAGAMFARVREAMLPTLEDVGSSIAGAFSGMDFGSFLPSFGSAIGAIKMGIATIGAGVVSVVGFVRGIPAMISGYAKAFDGIFGAGSAAKIARFSATFATVGYALPIVTGGVVALATAFGGVVASIVSVPALITAAAASALYFSGITVNLSEVMSTAGIMLRNVGAFGQIAFLSVGATLENFMARAATIPENFGRIANWFANDWGHIMASPILAIGELLKALGKSILDFVTNPTKGIGFDGSKILDDFKAVTANFPEMVSASLVSARPEIDRIMEGVRAKEAALTASLAGPSDADKARAEAGAAAAAMKPATIDAPAARVERGSAIHRANLAARLARAEARKGFVGPPRPGAAASITSPVADMAGGGDDDGAGGGGKSKKHINMFAGAADLGSRDAYKTISQAFSGRTGGGADDAVKTSRDTLAESRRQTKELRGLKRAVEANKIEIGTAYV